MACTSYLPQTLSETLAEYEESGSSLYCGEVAPGIRIKQEPGTESPAAAACSPSLDCRDKVYLDLSAPNLLLHKHAKTEYPETMSSLLSWTAKHPENWTRQEVLDWVYYAAQEHRFDGARVCGEAYQQLTGRDLCRLSRDQMVSMDPAYGGTLHELLAGLLEQCRFQEPSHPETISPETYTSIFDGTLMAAGGGAYGLSEVPSNEAADLSVFVDGESIQVGMAGHVYDIDVDLAAKLHLPDHTQQDCGYVSGDSEMDCCPADLARCPSHDSDIFGSDSLLMSDEEEEQARLSSLPAPPPRTASVSSMESSCGEPPKHSRSRMGKRSAPKGNHLWEFIRDSLKNPQFNPSLLRWEDKDNGVFKFVQSEAVATMWGRQKNNPAMTYEKLSRAMRFCRTAGYFADVPKNGKFPKKLCFKFGPKAYGWSD